MKFSPSVVTPEQMVATTPNMFLVDQYGKQESIDGDGALTINQAIRLSKLINKFAPAFTGFDNRITRGFRIEEVKLDGNDLIIVMSDGCGIIGRNVFKIPLRTDMKWENFTYAIPSGITNGRVLLFFEYTDLVQNNALRPVSQSYPRTPTIKFPQNQAEFNPIQVTVNLYNSETQEIIDSENWDENSSKILITSAIEFKLENNNISVSFNKDDRDPIYINGVKYPQQNLGYYEDTLGNISGGVIQEDTYISTEKKPTIIDVYMNHIVTQPHDDIYIEAVPSDLNNFYLFYNGILLYPGKDYSIDSDTKLTLHQITPVFGDHLYMFENLIDVDKGCLKNRFRQAIDIDKKKIEGLEGIDSNSSALIFYDGKLIFQDQYAMQVESGEIKFIFTLEEGKYLDITQIIPSANSNLEILFSGNVKYSSSYVQVHGINPKYSYLIFYDGKLMTEGVDLTLQKNVIVFKNGLVLDVNKKLVVVRV